MRVFWNLAVFLAFACLAFSCTKGKETALGPDGKPMISPSAEPDAVVMETEITVSKTHLKQIKRTDLLIWDLRDKEGDLLAGGIAPVPSFPHKLTVQAKDLRKSIAQNESMIFNARIVKFGEEHQPPKKGQLHLSVGMGADENPAVENPHVDEKRLERWMKRTSFVPAQKISVGSTIEAELRAIAF
jgi:hypothetical protein